MKFYGKAEQVAQRILTAFESPELLPNALAAVYIECGDVPSAKWSYTNRIMMFLFGTHDARGYRQWQAVNRYVKKGGMSFPILVPLIKHDDDNANGDSTPILYGFKSCNVFGFDQTDGEPLPEEAHLKRCVEEYAFMKVAEKWHIPITAHNAKSVGAKGYFAYDKQGKATPLISLGVMDMSTWAHELIHAADYRLSSLNQSTGQCIDNEYVAELGGCVLLKILGHEKQADIGGCYDYLKQYADSHAVSLIDTAIKYLNRTCQAVAYILKEADDSIGTSNEYG